MSGSQGNTFENNYKDIIIKVEKYEQCSLHWQLPHMIKCTFPTPHWFASKSKEECAQYWNVLRIVWTFDNPFSGVFTDENLPGIRKALIGDIWLTQNVQQKMHIFNA